MAVNKEAYKNLVAELFRKNISLVAVSKTKSIQEIKDLYDLGQRDFGENYVQELTEKQSQLPHDIRWHFIGHLQSNKVKPILPFIHLIQSVDSLKLLREIDKQAKKINRVVDCLLQVHIAQEETKFGLDELELNQLLNGSMDALVNVRVTGLMGIASLTEDRNKVRNEFRYLRSIFDKFSKLSIANCRFSILSMGMTADYPIAIEESGNMVRIGSLIFGARNQQ